MAAVGTMCLPLGRLADGTQATASHTLEHPPEAHTLHRPLRLALDETSSLDHISDTGLM